ncbi:zinc-binding dehydrogenase [Anaerolineales bacterium HSG25]|nr:zinc-binding dehydrogenase [Anaerolineales bacterium HSG25]
MTKHIPRTMRAIEIPFYDSNRQNLTLVEKTTPNVGSNQVLIKVSASPINPSDIVFLEGRYGVKKSLPVTPGFEASGRVVAVGSGPLARALLGRRVACGAKRNLDGCWAEYMVTDVNSCMPLIPSVSDEQGAMALANPLTAWGLVDLARRGGHQAIVQSGASSAVGRMILRLGQRFNMPMVHVVRRPANVALLQSMGARYVLNSNDPDFLPRLKVICRQLKASMAFDAVAGEMTGLMLKAMPRKGTLLLYGALSNKPSQFDPADPLFSKKTIAGFWLTGWLPKLSLVEKAHMALTVQRGLNNELKTTVQARLPLEQVAKGLQLYTQNMTKGKVLLIP